jgi:uncharacterized membrane-anchored protein YitT (DUF2179 family)
MIETSPASRAATAGSPGASAEGRRAAFTAAQPGRPPRHSWLEDGQAIVTGALFAALGVVVFSEARLVPGGTVGIALLLQYAGGLDLSLSLVLANAPFYLLALLRLGRAFTLKTLLAVALMALLVQWLPQGLTLRIASPLLAAVLGGLLAGVGMLMVFRHEGSLGGMNVLVLYLQQRFGWRPGLVQLAFDAAIVLAGGWLLADASLVLASIVAVFVLNMVLSVNHRLDRYATAAG